MYQPNHHYQKAGLLSTKLIAVQQTRLPRETSPDILAVLQELSGIIRQMPETARKYHSGPNKITPSQEKELHALFEHLSRLTYYTPDDPKIMDMQRDILSRGKREGFSLAGHPLWVYCNCHKVQAIEAIRDYLRQLDQTQNAISFHPDGKRITLRSSWLNPSEIPLTQEETRALLDALVTATGSPYNMVLGIIAYLRDRNATKTVDPESYALIKKELDRLLEIFYRQYL